MENTKEVYIKKTEDTDQESVSSGSVPGAGLFYEPFLHDLELIWQVDAHIDGFAQVGFSYA